MGRKRDLLILAAIMLIAFALRLYRLDGQSLWADEGNSVALAQRDLLTIAEHASLDIHPPLYYWLLHFWMRLFGRSEFALRFLSLSLGIALVFVTYTLGRHLFEPRVALLAALISAISPFQVYYSQEVRMYILVALLAALSLWAMVRFKTGASLTALLAYLLASTLALYTHYFAFTVILVANLVYGLWLVRDPLSRRARNVLLWSLAQIAVIILYLPWLNVALKQLSTWPATSSPLSGFTFAKNVLSIFSLGTTAENNALLMGFALILLLGLIPRKGEGYALVLATAFAILPPLMMYLLSLGRPFYSPKLLLLATPGCHLLLARGMDAGWIPHLVSRPLLRGATTLLLGVFITGSSFLSLQNYYYEPQYARDDYRGLVGYIKATSKEGDAVLLNAPGQIDVFSYYYQGSLPVYPLPGERPLDETKTRLALEEMLKKHRCLYAVLWATDESDPQRLIETYLDEHSFKALETWYGNVRLAAYGVSQVPIWETMQQEGDILFADSIRLLGYSLERTGVQSGDILNLTLFWRGERPLGERYKVFIHVLDAHGHMVGQRDAEPGGGAKITTTWQVGNEIADNYGLLILPGTPPGQYTVELGLYSLTSGERLLAREGEETSDHILLPPVEVKRPSMPPSLEALAIDHRLEADYGPLRLLGYNLSKLGFEHDAQEPINPGDILHLTLFWQAREKPEDELQLLIQVLDAKAQVIAQTEGPPLEGTYPLEEWEAGDMVRDQHYLFLPQEVPAGRYTIRLGVLNSEGTELANSPLDLQSLTIK